MYNLNVDDYFNDVAFRDWLIGSKLLAKKSSSDVISRLRRCTYFEPLDGYRDPAVYFSAIFKNPSAQSIAKGSRSSLYRASRLYFEFREHRSTLVDSSD